MPNYLEEIEQQLIELTERGAHRRRRGPRAEALAVAALVAVVAAVAVAIASIGSGHKPTPPAHQPTPPTSHKQATVTAARTATARLVPVAPAGGPVPAGFAPQSFTAISGLNWWLLGTAPCSSPPCTSIVRTVDGGRTFVGIPAPRTDHVSQLRFADSDNGFAFGPELWTTHDGGSHWRQVAVGGTVTELAASDGYVFAIVGGRLERSPVGSDLWAPVAAPSAYAGLWVRGSDVLYESMNNTSQQLAVSHDGGHTFTSYPVPPSVTCQFEEPAPPVIWEHCATGMMSATWRSADGGQSVQPSPTRSLPGPTLPNSSAFAAASADTAVVGWNRLYRTTDAGATWSPVSQPLGISEWLYVGFTDATHGAGLALTGKLGGAPGKSHEQLYYTTDGGASYHAVAITG